MVSDGEQQERLKGRAVRVGSRVQLADAAPVTYVITALEGSQGRLHVKVEYGAALI